ncbi:MAG TPA: NHLP family bacteriocin export ABC transporter peptidase/permease/ATPase subunit [Thermotogota bacterium]|nr:NHLP family bacteriocin export ABC transporter peptidase/permease/ATPase subunit [Thermotogota bacterium]
MESSKHAKQKRVHTPTIFQMEAVECGAACLGMVLGYYGKHVPLEELRYQCGVSRDGSKALNIVKAAQNYGLHSRGLKVTLEGLKKMAFPLILFWDFNHFVVLEGIKKDRYYLNDPALGKVTVDGQSFSKAFTGVVLTFSPTLEFHKGGKKPGIYKTLFSFLLWDRRAFFFLLLSGFILGLFGLLIPAFSKIFIDQIFTGENVEWFPTLLTVMGVGAAIMTLVTWMQELLLVKLEAKLSLLTSSRFVWHIFRLPLSFFSQRYAGSISNILMSNETVAYIVSRELTGTLIDLLFASFFLAMMFTYDVTLTLVSLGFALLNLALLLLTRTRVRNRYALLIKEEGKLAATAVSGIQSIETFKSMAQESIFFTRVADQYSSLQNSLVESQKENIALHALPYVAQFLSTAMLLLVGGWRIMNMEMTVGTFVAFQALMAEFWHPVKRIVEVVGSVHHVEADKNRLEDVLSYPIDPLCTQASPGEQELLQEKGRLEGHIELRNVTFGYNRLDPPLIEDFNLSIRPGERVALVGVSGSGKSTVGKLIAGLYQPWKGQVLVDGIPLEQIPRPLFTASFSYVDQDILLFSGTVKENLTLWDQTVPEPEIIQATMDACVHDEITAIPGEYNAVLQEGGKNFSGGVRQRIEIARALVKNPTFLVLDEATSALDARTEMEVDRNLRKRGCSCVIVAHRLSTIRDCDEIIVLEGGKVVQRGKHDQLITQPGPYAKLITA